MSNIDFTPGGVGCIAWLDVRAIKERQRKYAKIFDCAPWEPDMLSEIGHLGLVDVPMLVAEVEKYREDQGENGNTDREPRAKCVGAAQPPLQLVLTKQPETGSSVVVEAVNPFAQFFVVLLTKLPLGLRRLHTSNENKMSDGGRKRASLGG